MRAILIPAEGEPSVVELPDRDHLKDLQQLVGGYIEPVRFPPFDGFPDVLALANEDGLSMQLPFNQAASLLTGRPIVGPIVLLGTKGEDFVSAPDKWIKGVVDPSE